MPDQLLMTNVRYQTSSTSIKQAMNTSTKSAISQSELDAKTCNQSADEIEVTGTISNHLQNQLLRIECTFWRSWRSLISSSNGSNFKILPATSEQEKQNYDNLRMFSNWNSPILSNSWFHCLQMQTRSICLQRCNWEILLHSTSSEDRRPTWF